MRLRYHLVVGRRKIKMKANNSAAVRYQGSITHWCASPFAESFAGITKHSIPGGIPEGMPRETENPELPRRASWDEQGKAENRKKGPGVGTAHAGTQGLSAEQKPHPRHTHLPAEASQSALTGDACGHSRQRSRPRRVPEPPSPPPWS